MQKELQQKLFEAGPVLFGVSNLRKPLLYAERCARFREDWLILARWYDKLLHDKDTVILYEHFASLNPFSMDDLLEAHRGMMTALLDAPGRFRSGIC